jgi:hypothetical protein
VSQKADITVVVQGIGMLLEAIVETGCEYAKQKRMQTVDGATHEVDYVVTAADGAQVGVKVDSKTEQAVFIPQDCEGGKGKALAGRIAQRYAHARITQEMQRKGYQLAKQETQRDGTVKLVWQRWR